MCGISEGIHGWLLPSAHAHGRVDHYGPRISSQSLDGIYVDGISGNPCKHVWTYAVGLSDDYNVYSLTVHVLNILDLIHVHMLEIATGNTQINSDDPLWDGAGCGPENSCCYDAGMPWFFRQFPTTSYNWRH